MDFIDLMFFEYALNTMKETYEHKKTGKKFNYSFVIKSEEDIFTASTYLKNDFGQPHFPTIDLEIFYQIQFENISLNEANPFYKVRDFIFNKIGASSPLVNYPELYISIIKQFIETLENKEMYQTPKVFYNYKSLKYPDINFKNLVSTSNKYDVISLQVDIDSK